MIASASPDVEVGMVVSILDDVTIGGSPNQWAKTVVGVYHRLLADRIIGEQNNGGPMVESVIRSVDPRVAYKAVFASRGKRTRAEPVAALYEQGRVRHVGTLTKLEDELCTWTPDVDESPNRMDALVWAISELMDEAKPVAVVSPIAIARPGGSPWSSY